LEEAAELGSWGAEGGINQDLPFGAKVRAKLRYYFCSISPPSYSPLRRSFMADTPWGG
jgi:hypothetical protein